jgi:hypothetical protein
MLLAHWVKLEKKIYAPNLTPMCSPSLSIKPTKHKKKTLLNNRMQKTHEE